MVYFDDVVVPWDRVFLMNDIELANGAYGNTGAVLHMAHQVVNLKIAKTEAILAAHGEFAMDQEPERWSLTFNPGGFLKRIR